MKVRFATPADIPAIEALEKQAETAAHWSDEIYHSLFALDGVKRMVLVADDTGSVTGFIVARVAGDEWEIENIVVEQLLRRRGIASALVHNFIERARVQSAHQILLEVRQSNTSARKFYAKLGFIECGRRVRYYQHPEEDALCYCLKLDASPVSPAEP